MSERDAHQTSRRDACRRHAVRFRWLVRPRKVARGDLNPPARHMVTSQATLSVSKLYNHSRPSFRVSRFITSSVYMKYIEKWYEYVNCLYFGTVGVPTVVVTGNFHIGPGIPLSSRESRCGCTHASSDPTFSGYWTAKRRFSGARDCSVSDEPTTVLFPRSLYATPLRRRSTQAYVLIYMSFVQLVFGPQLMTQRDHVVCVIKKKWLRRGTRQWPLQIVQGPDLTCPREISSSLHEQVWRATLNDLLRVFLFLLTLRLTGICKSSTCIWNITADVSGQMACVWLRISYSHYIMHMHARL
jgi:hypothetical protein